MRRSVDPLAVDAVDLESLVLARNDTHPDGDWWFDPRSGESLYFGIDEVDDLPALIEGVHVLIPGEPQPDTDIDDFLTLLADDDSVDDAVTVDLYQSFHRRGGSKRFRERVVRSPVVARWQRFTIDRETVRALDWLLERDLVEPSSADALRAELAGCGRLDS